MKGQPDWSPSGIRFWLAAATVVVVGLAVIGATRHDDLLHALGVLPRQPSSTYNWWSGAASVIESVIRDLAIISLLVFHTNCHAQGCWRLGRYPVEGTPYKTCAAHHPHVPDSGADAEQIHAAHHAARQAGSPAFGEPNE